MRGTDTNFYRVLSARRHCTKAPDVRAHVLEIVTPMRSRDEAVRLDAGKALRRDYDPSHMTDRFVPGITPPYATPLKPEEKKNMNFEIVHDTKIEKQTSRADKQNEQKMDGWT